MRFFPFTKRNSSAFPDKTLGTQNAPPGYMLALEPRIMYDAAGVATAVDDKHDAQQAPETAHIDNFQQALTDNLDLFKEFRPPTQKSPQELVFIDSKVEDYDQLIQGLTPNAKVVILGNGRDGLTQINEELAQYTDIEAIHIVSHGGPGSLLLGDATLSLESLEDNATSLQSWRDSLSTNADIMLYGCDVAAGKDGADFVKRLSELTDADVAASIDKTGNAQKGGDWDMEYIYGLVESDVAAAWQNYTGLLGEVALVDSGQNIDIGQTEGGALGDFDSDGDLDVFLVNTQNPDKVFFNDGDGNFTDSGQNLGGSTNFGQEVAVADLDADGDLDAYVVNSGASDKVYFNNGSGIFTDSGQPLSTASARAITLGDLDGDGDLDAFIANYGGNQVYLNSGSGSFSNSGQSLGSGSGQDVDLADLDADGDLDAFVANWGSEANEVWLNNGSGSFSSGGTYGNSVSMGVSLGDVDADGDIDAFVANLDGQPDKIWLNDGSANFSDSGQNLGSSASNGVKLEDVDQDGDLDAFVVGGNFWLNDGTGTFSNTGFGTGGREVLFGNLDNDGDKDAFLAIRWGNRMWYNDAVPQVTAGGVLNYTENDTPTVIDSSITVSDPDNTELVGAQITISANFSEFEDELVFADTGTISGDWDPSTATLYLSGTDTKANYQAALRSVQYINHSEDPFTEQRTVSFAVNDGMVDSAVASATVTVSSVNDAPFLDNSGTPAVPAINEDTASPAYSLFDVYSTLLPDKIYDPDFHNTVGIAVTGADNTNGNWQYSIDGGTNWLDFGSLSDSNATVLQGFTKLSGKVQDTANLATGDLIVNGSSVGPVTLTGTQINGINMSGASNLATAINAVSSDVIAELEPLYAGSAAGAASTTEEISFDINGVSVSVSIPGPASSLDVAQAVVNEIMAVGPQAKVHAWIGNDSNGGVLDSVVIEGHKGDIVIANLYEPGTASSGLANGTYTADASHNTGEIFILPTNGSFTITTSAGDDTILNRIGMGGGAANTTVSGDTANDGEINVTFPLNKLRFVPNADFNGTASITFRLWDQTNALTNAATGVNVSVNGGDTPYSADAESISITVDPVNDAPTATNLSAPESIVEDSGPVYLADIMVTDVDSPDVTVTLTLSDPDAGTLSTGTEGLVTSSYDATTGVWTASGPKADVNALLAATTFTITPAYTLDFTISTSVDDGVASPVTGSKAITVSPPSDTLPPPNIDQLDTSTDPILDITETVTDYDLELESPLPTDDTILEPELFTEPSLLDQYLEPLEPIISTEPLPEDLLLVPDGELILEPAPETAVTDDADASTTETTLLDESASDSTADITSDAEMTEDADPEETDELIVEEELTNEATEEENTEEETEEDADQEEVIAAAPVVEGAPVIVPTQKTENQQTTGGTEGLSAQLATENAQAETERTELLKIFEEVYDLLQCK